MLFEHACYTGIESICTLIKNRPILCLSKIGGQRGADLRAKWNLVEDTLAFSEMLEEVMKKCLNLPPVAEIFRLTAGPDAETALRNI